MDSEVASLKKVMSSGEHPFTAILGGAKVSGKIQIINHLLDKCDNLIIGGGMMFTFIKAMGGEVGSSLVEDDFLETAKKAIIDAKAKGVNLLIPTDTIIADAFNNDANKKTVKTDQIPTGWMGLDIGPETTAKFQDVIMKSKIVLWNGPMGVFEMSSFEKGTKEVALTLAKATANGTYTLVGGGDSVAAINKYNLADKVSYVSTGGGAMLEYIEGRELPGVAAIEA